MTAQDVIALSPLWALVGMECGILYNRFLKGVEMNVWEDQHWLAFIIFTALGFSSVIGFLMLMFCRLVSMAYSYFPVLSKPYTIKGVLKCLFSRSSCSSTRTSSFASGRMGPSN